jgi:hypothetical protein
MVSSRMLSLDFPFIDTSVDTPAEAAISALIFVYVLAAWFNTRIPDTGVEMRPMPRNKLELLPDFWRCNTRLWQDKLGQISLATTTLFWGVSGNLRYIVLAWAAAALGYSVTQASSLVGGGGGGHGRRRGGGLGTHEAGPGHQRDAAGHRHGLAGDPSELHRQRLGGGAFPRSARRSRRISGGAHECAAAASRPQPDGRGPLDRGSELQRTSLHPEPWAAFTACPPAWACQLSAPSRASACWWRDSCG